MSQPHSRALDAHQLALEPLPLKPGSVLAGTPAANVRTLHQLGEIDVGLWELTEGTVTDTEVEELFVVLSGAGTVTFNDGEIVPLRPGVVVRLRAGEQTTWTITSTLRKLWIA